MNIASHLSTDRLRLAPVSTRDFGFFWQLVGNAEVRRYLGGPVPWRRRVAQFRGYLRGHSTVGIWVVKPKRGGGAFGLVLLHPHKDGVDYELSYEFKPTHWGQGFATEATGRVLAHAQDDLGLERVIAETQAANAASCRMLAAQGFVEDTRLERFGAEQIIFAKY